MISVGKVHTLAVASLSDFGAYLDAENLGKVLLSKRHISKKLEIGDAVKVFIYLDSDATPLATTQRPRIQLGQFAYLKAVSVGNVGAFLDIGIDKDVLVPFAEQHQRMEEGRSYIVYLYLDGDGRMVASSKIEKFLDDGSNESHEFKAKQAVKLLIANSTDLGFRAIVNHSHWGVLYSNEVSQRLSFGQSIDGFIHQVRDDGRLDLRLQMGAQSKDKNSQIVLAYLQKRGGYAALHDKSSPDEISRAVQMSKGAFKKALSNLYKQRLITLESEGVRLVKS